MTTEEQRERKRAQDRATYAADPESKKAKVAIYRAMNIEKVRESNRLSSNRYNARKRAERALGGSDGRTS